MAAPTLDVITIGRSSVDLYGQQVGGRLEDMASFSKAVGGCPANIAIGTARLGLKSALITRVGDEAMGRFVREQMAREGVATQGIRTDPSRLTALVILGVRDDRTFPLIFYRENCADMALEESDVDESFVASAGAIVVTAAAAGMEAACFLGDDVGDLPAFDALDRLAAAGLRTVRVGVRTEEAPAALLERCDLVVEGPEGALAVLRHLAGLDDG